jgi:hypothetical protein
MVIKEGFRANSTSVEAITMNDHSIMIYSKYIVKTKITNSFSEYRVSNIDFIATNIKRYNAILG